MLESKDYAEKIAVRQSAKAPGPPLLVVGATEMQRLERICRSG